MTDMVERRSSAGVSTNENENEVEDVTESFIDLGLLCKFFQWILYNEHGLSMIYYIYIYNIQMKFCIRVVLGVFFTFNIVKEIIAFFSNAFIIWLLWKTKFNGNIFIAIALMVNYIHQNLYFF